MDVLATVSTSLFCVQKKAILVWILLHAIVTCESNEFDMQDYCDKEISMTLESVYQVELELEDTDIYDRHSVWFFSNRRKGTCETTVRAWYSPYSKLMLYFDDFDLDCEDGHLEFYIGRTGYSRVNGLESDICGDSKPKGVFTIDDIYFRIKYIPRKPRNSKDVFTIIITAFSDDDNCDDLSYKCDNSRCINKDVACNDYDSCGDGSGCEKQTTAIIVGAIAGSLIVIGIVVFLVVCYVWSRRNKSKATATYQSNSSAAVGYNASGHVGFHQPTYGVNYEGPCPTNLSQHHSASVNMPSTQITPGQQFDYATRYDQMNDLPPPYSEVAQNDLGNNQPNGMKQPQELESPDNQSKKQQDPIYEEIQNDTVHQAYENAKLSS